MLILPTRAVIFILRLYSIYAKNNVILYGFSTLLVCEIAIKIVRPILLVHAVSVSAALRGGVPIVR